MITTASAQELLARASSRQRIEPAGELAWWEARVADAAARQHIPLSRLGR